MLPAFPHLMLFQNNCVYRFKRKDSISRKIVLFYCLKALFQICQNIINMLNTDGQTNGCRCNAGSQQLFLCHLRMCGRSRMNYQRLYIGYICQQREDFQRFCKLLCLFLGAVQLKGKD